jgi:hypothetical protein
LAIADCGLEFGERFIHVGQGILAQVNGFISLYDAHGAGMTEDDV